jgi:hypothetical protein
VDTGEIGTILAELIPTSDNGNLLTSILWRVDYDVAAGNHTQIELSSELGLEE